MARKKQRLKNKSFKIQYIIHDRNKRKQINNERMNKNNKEKKQTKYKERKQDIPKDRKKQKFIEERKKERKK